VSSASDGTSELDDKISAMLPRQPRFKSLCGVVVILCSVASVRSIANAQTIRLTDEDARTDFERPGGPLDEIFTKCGDRYYLGMFSNAAPPKEPSKEVERLVEFTLKSPFQFKGDILSPAAIANGIRWQGVVVMSYSTFRLRSTTNGAWNRWGDFLDDITGPIGVAIGTNRNGDWHWSPPLGLFFHWGIAGGFMSDVSLATATTAVGKGKGTVTCPGLTGDLTDAQMLEEKRKAAEEEQNRIYNKAKDDAVSGNHAPHGPAPD
jgi:hypothetical protein